MVVPLCAIPPSREGFYAVNNQYLEKGPKGFTEFKMLGNGDTFVRIDLPGVPIDGVKVSLAAKKGVLVMAEAPKEHKHDSSHRKYFTVTGLVCKCCEISSLTSHMCDGVLRLLLSTRIVPPKRSSSSSTSVPAGGPDTQDDLRCNGPHKFRLVTNPYDPALTGTVLEPHPCVLEGSLMAHESKQLQNGSLYVRLDMPGVPKDKFTVSVEDGKVMVAGEAPAVTNDSGARFYSGEVAMLDTANSIPNRRIKTIAKNGVIRLIIPPI